MALGSDSAVGADAVVVQLQRRRRRRGDLLDLVLSDFCSVIPLRRLT